MTPSGFIAVLCGWFVTEVGRQPYTVYGVLKTADSISPVIPEQIALPLLSFIIVYTFVFGAGSYYILKLIAKGPDAGKDAADYYYEQGMEASIAKTLSKTK